MAFILLSVLIFLLSRYKDIRYLFLFKVYYWFYFSMMIIPITLTTYANIPQLIIVNPIVKIFSILVIGVISPYPTETMVTIEKYRLSKYNYNQLS